MKHIYIRKNRLFYTKILFILSVFCVSSIFSEATLYLGKEGISNFVPTIQDQDFTVEEGSPSGSEVGTIAATSNDTGLTFTMVNATFAKEGNPPEGDSEQDPAYDAMAIFNLDQASGALTIANPKYLLAVLGPVVLAIDVTDSSGEVASAIITVNISDMEVDIVENSNLNWTTVANHPQGHSEATGGAIGQNLYVFGGFTSNFAPKASVFALNTEGDSWSRLADMPPMASNSGGGGATHMGFTDDGTDIYIAAGYAADASGNAQQFGARRVYKYTVAEDRYDELPSLPIDRSAGALEYVANKLYYMAGTNRSRNEDQGDLLVLDLDDLNSGWSYLSAMPNPRNHIGTAVFDGQIYVFGGQKEHDEALVPQDDVHRYDPETDTWTQLADMPEPFNHIHASVFLYGDYIYSIGGQIEHNATPYASVYAYDPVENTWQQFTDLPARRFSIVGAGIDGKLYASGGNNARTTYVATLPEELLSNEDAMQVQKNALNGIKIYPNPAKNEIFVTDIDQNLTISNIGIYDITGRLVQDYSSEITGSKRSFQFPISQLLSGVYIMRITNENGEILNKQILIE